jgi:hypothetical protein
MLTEERQAFLDDIRRKELNFSGNVSQCIHLVCRFDFRINQVVRFLEHSVVKVLLEEGPNVV